MFEHGNAHVLCAFRASSADHNHADEHVDKFEHSHVHAGQQPLLANRPLITWQYFIRSSHSRLSEAKQQLTSKGARGSRDCRITRSVSGNIDFHARSTQPCPLQACAGILFPFGYGVCRSSRGWELAVAVGLCATESAMAVGGFAWRLRSRSCRHFLG